MADLGAIFSTAARCSSLALELYKLTSAGSEGRKEISQLAQSISNFSSTIKQIGTTIREDDTLISSEAVETLGDILDQCSIVLNEAEATTLEANSGRTGDHSRPGHSLQFSAAELERLLYLQAHLDSLRGTVSVLQQTLYTAQSIIWSKVRPAISPQQAAAAVANEKTQLENAVIEQQISILLASKLYEPLRPDARLLMEDESTRSLAKRENGSPKPTDLHRYQERFIATLDITETGQDEWYPAVCSISRPHLERLLDRWTRLRQFFESINYEERQMETQRRETQQPTVESEDDEEAGRLPRFKSSAAELASPTPHRPGSVQPLFTESGSLPIPGRDTRYGPTAPISPASSYGASPRTSITSLTSPISDAPIFPRTWVSNLPVEAAAAVEAKDKDDDANLEIPWRLCTRKYHWKYIDNKVVDKNTDLPPAEAFADRNSWTEISSSWVCKEAIKEHRYKYNQVQKERRDGRRTKLETYFLIERPLTFDQVQRLVDRTVELFRANELATPPPSRRRASSSFNRGGPHDRDKTPLANPNSLPERSTTYHHPPAPPASFPVLERTVSLPPGTGLPYLAIPKSNTLPPIPQGPYGNPIPPPSYSPQTAQYFPFSQTAVPNMDNPRLPTTYAPMPHHQPHHVKSRNEYSSGSTNSDSDSAPRRKTRSRSRRSSTASQKKKHSSIGTLARVGGLAALLDGIVDLGVL